MLDDGTQKSGRKMTVISGARKQYDACNKLNKTPRFKKQLTPTPLSGEIEQHLEEARRMIHDARCEKGI